MRAIGIFNVRLASYPSAPKRVGDFGDGTDPDISTILTRAIWVHINMPIPLLHDDLVSRYLFLTSSSLMFIYLQLLPVFQLLERSATSSNADERGHPRQDVNPKSRVSLAIQSMDIAIVPRKGSRAGTQPVPNSGLAGTGQMRD